MKMSVALGIAAASLAVAAYAQPETRVFVAHAGADLNIDANSDGWIARAEAAAAADRIFDDLDSNDDGRLNEADGANREFDIRVAHGANGVHVEGFDEDKCDQTVEGEGSGRRVTVICRDGEGGERRTERHVTILRGGEDVSEDEMRRIERDVEREVQHATREAERAERDAARAERLAEDAERHVQREVIVVNGSGGEWTSAVPPVPPVPPVGPPMFMMLFANSEEADSNGDGALSRDEFRAQHLRFFDASDANGDGRVRASIHPQPPTPPTPPAPPEPPRRR